MDRKIYFILFSNTYFSSVVFQNYYSYNMLCASVNYSIKKKIAFYFLYHEIFISYFHQIQRQLHLFLVLCLCTLINLFASIQIYTSLCNIFLHVVYVFTIISYWFKWDVLKIVFNNTNNNNRSSSRRYPLNNFNTEHRYLTITSLLLSQQNIYFLPNTCFSGCWNNLWREKRFRNATIIFPGESKKTHHKIKSAVQDRKRRC